jgi:hypothetical protein
VIAIAVVTFLGLLLVAGLSVGSGSFHHWIASRSLGRLPVGIVWFAAIGGSLVSLKGIFKHHKEDWSSNYNAWHMLRPWTGAVMGVLAAFFLLVSTELATVNPGAAGASGGPPHLNPDVYYVAAFIAGFAEGSFRDLVERLTRTIFGPGNGQASAHPQDREGEPAAEVV